MSVCVCERECLYAREGVLYISVCMCLHECAYMSVCVQVKVCVHVKVCWGGGPWYKSVRECRALSISCGISEKVKRCMLPSCSTTLG